MASKGDRSRSLDSARTRHSGSVPAMQALPTPATQSTLDSSSDNSFMDTNVPKHQAIANVPHVPKLPSPGDAIVRFAGRAGTPSPTSAGAGHALQFAEGSQARAKPPPSHLWGGGRSGPSRGGARLQPIADQSPEKTTAASSQSGQDAERNVEQECRAEAAEAIARAQHFEDELRQIFAESQQQYHQETEQAIRNAEVLANQRVEAAQDEAFDLVTSACSNAAQTRVAEQHMAQASEVAIAQGQLMMSSVATNAQEATCLLYTSPSPRDY